MKTRRNCLIGLTAFAASAAAINANTLHKVLKVGPRPKLIPGNPAKVDFGHGLLVPMSKEAFHTLWEGDDRWIAYGHGFGGHTASATAQAEVSALGTMKLYLLTLAFAPDRLTRVDGGGWVLKSGSLGDLVKGEIQLPGRPLMPTTDAFDGHVDGVPGNEPVHATTGWLVWKKDITLDYVRQHARLL